MGVFGTTFRTALAITVVPLTGLAIAALNPSAPAAGFPLIYTALLAGLLTGLAGSAVEAMSGSQLNAQERFAIWTVVAAIITYFIRLLLPHLPFGVWGALATGLLVGFFESLLPDRVNVR